MATHISGAKRGGSSASGGYSIRQLPVNLFASVMGITGLSLAWRMAVNLLSLPALPGEVLGWTGLAVFIALISSYAVKFARHPAAVHAEFTHPIMGNFFGTIAIGILLLSAFLFRYSAVISEIVWISGVLLTFTLAYIVVQKFLTSPQKVETTVPPLLIPGVATLDIPVTGSSMPFSWAHEVNLFAFATGSVMALVLVVLIFQRLRHFETLTPASRPVLMVLVAPFGVGFIAYTNLGTIDMLASVLIYFGWFLLLVLTPVIFRSENSFGVAWWAIGFPMAALSIASFRYAEATGGPILLILAELLFGFLALSIGILFVRTLHLVLSGSLWRFESAG
jgi:tellurite resistance protein